MLPLTHEETVTFHAREIQSYRDLPQMLYHFQTKDRDEPRPRAGLLRVREFIMKDSYSFDRDEEGLDKSFQLHKGAYDRIFERCELEVYAVQAESGMMGGSESMDYLAPAETGENTLVTCERGDYAADLEIARGIPRAPEFPEALDAPEEVETPGRDDDRGRRAAPRASTRRRRRRRCPSSPTARSCSALVRGDDRLDEGRCSRRSASAFRPATEEEIREAFGADPGSIGPVGVSVEVVADEALREGQFVAGANRTGLPPARRGGRARLRGPLREHPRGARRATRARTAAARCGFQTAIEVGHIFKLETHYTEPLDATFLDEDGKEKPLIMGSYGIGPARTMAAIVEQHYDEHGIKWPRSVAPYDVHLIALPGLEEQAEEVARKLDEAGDDVLLDDRDQRAGEKFADADLIGLPVRVTVGKKTLDDGAVDVRDRETGEERRVGIAELGSLR